MQLKTKKNSDQEKKNMAQTPCGCSLGSTSYQAGMMSNNGGSNAAFWTLIILAVLVGCLFIGGIIWCACQYNKKKTLEIDINRGRGTCGGRRTAAFGDSASAASEFPMGSDDVTNHENHEAMVDANGNVIVQEFADGTGDNNGILQDMAEGANDAWNNTKNFFNQSFGAEGGEEGPMMRMQQRMQQDDSASYYGESQAKCFDGSDWRNDGGTYSHNLNVNNLMPASWRNSMPCTSLNDTDTTQWSAYAPSKQAFDNYITSAGSSRLAVNTRSALSRQTGLINPLLNLRGTPPIPLGSNAFIFNDTDQRQSLIFDSVGSYPELTWC
jgi:hypothetical protein